MVVTIQGRLLKKQEVKTVQENMLDFQLFVFLVGHLTVRTRFTLPTSTWSSSICNLQKCLLFAVEILYTNASTEQEKIAPVLKIRVSDATDGLMIVILFGFYYSHVVTALLQFTRVTLYSTYANETIEDSIRFSFFLLIFNPKLNKRHHETVMAQLQFFM